MNGEQFLDSLESLDSDLIEAADAPVRKKRGKVWVKWTAVAAALCLVAGGVFAARSYRGNTTISDPPPSGLTAQRWTEDMAAAEYFRYNREPKSTMGQSGASLAYPPYAAAVSLDDARAALEAEGVIPEIPDHTEQSFMDFFNGDGSLYKVQFFWMRRSEGSLEGYSDLKLTAAPRELREISDAAAVAVDENGDVINPDVTVTERDGVYIVAEGYEKGGKTLTWQNGAGWYQAEGSWNDSYEDVAALMEWFWDHPLDLERFAAMGEDIFIRSVPAEYPDAFAGALPDFAALGYTAQSETLYLTDGDRPVYFAGDYIRQTDGARVRWEVGVTADGYDLGKIVGWLSRVTEEDVAAALERIGSSVQFDHRTGDDDCRITLTLSDGAAAVDAWKIIQALR